MSGPNSDFAQPAATRKRKPRPKQAHKTIMIGREQKLYQNARQDNLWTMQQSLCLDPLVYNVSSNSSRDACLLLLRSTSIELYQW